MQRCAEERRRKGRSGGKKDDANSKAGLGNNLGTGRGKGSWARMSSSNNIRVGVVKRRSKMLDANGLKAVNAECQRGISTSNQAHNSSFGNASQTDEIKPERY